MPDRYDVEVLPSAARQLGKVPRPARLAVVEAIDGLATDPRPIGTKLLSGTGPERLWRVAIGSFRVVYRIDEGRRVVVIVRVADRREAYRQTDVARLLVPLRGER